MRYVIGFTFVLLGTFLSIPSHSESSAPPAAVAPAAAEVQSCTCPELACDPCAIQRGVTFYSAKCGTKKNEKIKSCKRPTCLAIEEATKECPVVPQASQTPREPIVVGQGSAKAMEPAAAAPAPAPKPKAEVKPEVQTQAAPVIGKVRVIQGSISIVDADGKKTQVTQDTDLKETQTVETGKDSKALVELDGGNKLHVLPDSAVKVEEFKDQKLASRKALFNLIKGKVRNQVNQKYDGSQSYYRVRTRAAVAGVRGTDFLVEHSEDIKMETKISTFEGKVLLASLDEKQTREIIRGEGARFSADMPDPSFKDGDMSDFIERGTLSPVYQITPEELKALDKESLIVAKNKAAPKGESAICERPRGLFNQCYWACTGNPNGESKCRVDKPGVQCVRARCNANGKWSEKTNLPAATSDGVCPADGYTVKDCDY